MVFAVLVAAAAVLTARPASAAPGPWVWPLSPRPEVVRGFDPPDSPWGAGHRGVDLAGTAHQQVRAAGAGVVTYAGLLAGRGVVTISHGTLETTYEPVTASLGVGAQVGPGDPIGRLTGVQSHCAPRVCLHWGALRDGHYVDPLSLLGSGPPRLLPLGPSRSGALAPANGVDRDGAPTLARATARDATTDRDRSTGQSATTDQARTKDQVTTTDQGADDVTSPASAHQHGVLRSGTADTPAASEPVDDATTVRARSASVSTITAPAAGALAGAVTAGIVVRLAGRGGGPSPTRPPPADPPARSGSSRRPRGGVVDLAAVRQRLRGAA